MSTDRDTLLSDDYEQTTTFCGCGYFRSFSLVRWRSSRDDESRSRGGGWSGCLQEERGGRWGSEKLKGLKEISEKIAGPKWKNFIRSFSSGRKKMRRDVDFSYDLKNYSLNFDDGGGSEDPSPERTIIKQVEVASQFLDHILKHVQLLNEISIGSSHYTQVAEDIHEGQYFRNKEELMMEMRKWALDCKFEFRPMWSDRKRVLFGCVDVRCSWKMCNG